MCGLFALIGDRTTLDDNQHAVNHRGPEDTRTVDLDRLLLVFHRLVINGTDARSAQPFHIGSVYLMCNGEIYNHKALEEMYSITPESESDCEVIAHLYGMYGFENMLMLLDGEFAIILYDTNTGCLWVGRDRYGVRQLFIGWNQQYGDVYPRAICVASEAKALTFLPRCRQVRPGTLIQISSSCCLIKEKQWFVPLYPARVFPATKTLIRETFINAVRKRLMSTRRVGCLLSGGFDSSIIASVASRLLASTGERLATFSIGLEGSPDIIAAREVASYCNTEHHEIIISEAQALSMLVRTVYVTGSEDVTTNRASVWHLLVCEYIRDNTEVKVVLSGEYADEHGSYAYFANAPDARSYHEESLRLFEDIGYFDNLRSDHCISACGLEGRIPFADNDFMQLILSTSPKSKMFGSNGRIEKQLFRDAFAGLDYLPEKVLWRRKNGFSDSVSSTNRSWSAIIKEYVNTQITDEDYLTSIDSCNPKPLSKEALFYQRIHAQTYPKGHELTPYQWLPRWCGNVTDPSARALGNLYTSD